MWSIPGFKLIPLRQILGMGKPQGAVLEMKSADGAIYPFQYPDVTKAPEAVVPGIADIMRFISLPVMRQGEMDHALVQEIKVGGHSVGMGQTGLVAFTRKTQDGQALVLANHSWEQTVEVSVARSNWGASQAQCLSQGAQVKITENEIKVTLAPWQYGLLAFGQLTVIATHRDGPGCPGNVAPQNVKGIKQLIAEKAFDEVDVDQKIFEGIVDVPVKVFILNKQIPRAPPEGFIWDRLINNTLEIYYSSPSVYEGHKHSLIEDAYHALIENRLLGAPLNELTPKQAHEKAVVATREMFHVRKTPQDSRKDKGKIKVVVPSRRYKQIPGTDETMLAETDSGFNSDYEAFRGQVDQIYHELGERRWIIKAQGDIRKVRNILEENDFKLSQSQTEQIETILTGILTGMVKPRGKLKVEAKQAAQDNLTKVLKGIRFGGEFLTGVDQVLVSINEFFEIRRKSIESMSCGTVQGRLSDIQGKINKRNRDIIKRLDEIEMFRQEWPIGVMEKHLLGLRRLRVIKGEPDLSDWYGYVSSALKALAEKQEDKFVAELASARQLIENSTVLYHLWSLYVRELINEEIRSAKSVNRVEILEKVFLSYSRQAQLNLSSPDEGAYQRALWWAGLYQAIFIPLKIKDTPSGQLVLIKINATRSDKRVPSRVFQAATFYHHGLERYTLEKIRGWRLVSKEPSRVRQLSCIRSKLSGVLSISVVLIFSVKNCRSLWMQLPEILNLTTSKRRYLKVVSALNRVPRKCPLPVFLGLKPCPLTNRPKVHWSRSLAGNALLLVQQHRSAKVM